MKKYILLFVFSILIFACNKDKEVSSTDFKTWSKRHLTTQLKDSLEYGKSYLSIYSQIYSVSEHKTHSLTAMVSMRNTSDTDTIYLLKAEYFDTKGTSVRTYFDKTIFLAPLETTEIIIDEVDKEGGTGSNFIFEWKTPKDCPEPLFEGIMNSTKGQQGLSFSTQSKRIK
ncbi:DUF3124 domain-containing protein [Polaribacter sp. Asnod1-A03]|uniref:DUF3124 domain-containing protein n=1 Tax=Polaribacter sp. Asnod1-A03 TaxID=3160581 RepID=UPI00386CD428